MKEVNFSDWQEMALKKDVEQIKKKIYSQEPIFFSLCWELILVLGSIIIDHLFDTEKTPEWIWFGVIGLAVVPALAVIMYNVIKWIRLVSFVKKGNINIKGYVDLFDNQISYWVMLSNAYTDMLVREVDGTKSEKEFLYREGCYYNNKTMHAVYAMKPVFHKVFTWDLSKVRNENLVDLERLLNVIDVMYEQQKRMDNAVKGIISPGIKKQQELNNSYQLELKNFLNDVNAFNQKKDLPTFDCHICGYKDTEH